MSFLPNTQIHTHSKCKILVLNSFKKFQLNFQLIEPEDHETVVLQFGRVGKHDFTMDVRWPFTPLQAFGVVLSSFDSKIACD